MNGTQGEYESQWAAIVSVAAKIGCTGETLRGWVRQRERDTGKRDGVTTAEKERILRKASAYFAQAELDRRFKR